MILTWKSFLTRCRCVSAVSKAALKSQRFDDMDKSAFLRKAKSSNRLGEVFEDFEKYTFYRYSLTDFAKVFSIHVPGFFRKSFLGPQISRTTGSLCSLWCPLLRWI